MFVLDRRHEAMPSTDIPAALSSSVFNVPMVLGCIRGRVPPVIRMSSLVRV